MCNLIGKQSTGTIKFIKPSLDKSWSKRYHSRKCYIMAAVHVAPSAIPSPLPNHLGLEGFLVSHFYRPLGCLPGSDIPASRVWSCSLVGSWSSQLVCETLTLEITSPRPSPTSPLLSWALCMIWQNMAWQEKGKPSTWTRRPGDHVQYNHWLVIDPRKVTFSV